MKQIKVMLTVIILLGAVGGVLAIKTKRMNSICTAAPVNGACTHNPDCNLIVVGQVGSGNLRCTTALIGQHCPQKCPVLARTTSLEE